MKRMEIFVLLLAFALVASLETPALATEKPLKIEFMIPGYIPDESTEISGTMSLTLTGRFKERTPDYDKEDSGEWTYGPYEYEDTWEYI
jgi:hypothetical protein